MWYVIGGCVLFVFSVWVVVGGLDSLIAKLIKRRK